ncbi:MAG: hypothetical protein V2I62_04250 [Bacteroidales bacterium]|jgi:hypothetical protein|nr:hypothetical protein [Bacteroidales bacterium]
MKKLILILCFMMVFFVFHAQAEMTTGSVFFRWDAPATNTDGTPCTDLAGYAIYRSAESGKWTEQTGIKKAFVTTNAKTRQALILMPDGGNWYWIVRSFDLAGNFSEASNELHTEIDLSVPSKPENYRIQGLFVFGE